MAKWPDKYDEEIVYSYTCCRSRHQVTLRVRGDIWFVKHEKTTIHRRTHVTNHRLGPRKETNAKDILLWVHLKTCPNAGWCEFHKQMDTNPTALRETFSKVA